MCRFAVLGLLLAVAVTGTLVPGVGPAGSTHIDGDERATVDAGNASLDVWIADTPDQRAAGLSNVTSIGPREGMLFVHEEVDERSYVMRDMQFPIDIVFIDADGTVNAIHEAPLDGPDRYAGVGQYVLELPYGVSDRIGLDPGDRVRVDGAQVG